MPRVAGLLLAAGAGRRFGGPKALARTEGEAWVDRAAAVLRRGGCDPVVVVVGAAGDQVRAQLDDTVIVVEAADWAEGMGASLRAGLRAVAGLEADAVMVHLVDLPDVGRDVVTRLAAAAAPGVLARADYDSGPGHPVLIGRDHWAGVAEAATGDQGAREYLVRCEVTLVPCSDLASGRDVDEPPMLDR